MSTPTPAAARTWKCMGKRATLVGTNGNDRIRGTTRPDVIVAKGGKDDITARGGNDIVCAGAGDDTVSGGSGADRIAGGGGQDLVVGGKGKDLLKGDGGPDFLAGLQANDRFIGGSGFDMVIFALADRAVAVDLAAGSAVGEGNDSLSGVESILGSDFNDVIRGDAAANALGGGLGDDVLHGRGGTDFSFYVLSSAAVTVDLQAGTASGGEGNDQLASFEGVFGSSFNDTLLGTSGGDFLFGWDGNDSIDGRGGMDVCVGETTQNCPSAAPPTSEPESPSAALASRASSELQGQRSPVSGSLQTKLDQLPGLPNTKEAVSYTVTGIGAHACNYSSTGASFVYSSVTAFPPGIVSSGYVAWRPVLRIEVAGGYLWQYGGWSAPTYGGSNWYNQELLVDRGYSGRSRVAVYHQIYDYDAGLYSGHYGAALFMNPATGRFFDGGYYCSP